MKTKFSTFILAMLFNGQGFAGLKSLPILNSNHIPKEIQQQFFQLKPADRFETFRKQIAGAIRSGMQQGKYALETLLPHEAVGDFYSYSNYQDVSVKHFDLQATIDFNKKQIRGDLTLHLEWNEKVDSNLVVLDSMNLHIKTIKDPFGNALPFSLGEADPELGQALVIECDERFETVQVEYETASQDDIDFYQKTGLRFNGSFFHTESWGTLTRSWLPIMDTPAVRMTYSANIDVEGNEGAIALMTSDEPKKIKPPFTVEMNYPVASYLLFLAAGPYAYQATSSNTGVFAPQKSLGKAANAYSLVPQFIKDTEGVLGKFPFKQTDVIAVPNYGVGGMENPGLISMDIGSVEYPAKRQTVLRHELLHAWAGGKVVMTDLSHKFMVEGPTVYLEIIAQKKKLGNFDSYTLHELNESKLRNFLRRVRSTLILDPRKNYRPKDNFSQAYSNGGLYFYWLGSLVGHDKFVAFLKDYFEENNGYSVTIDDFLEEYLEAFGGQVEQKEVLETSERLLFGNQEMNDWDAE